MLDTMIWAGVGIVCGVAGSTIVHKIQGLKNIPVEVEKETGLSFAVPQDVNHSTTPRIRVGVIDAMNGRILEVSTAIPNNHNHYDWKTEMYVISENQKLSEAMSLVMLMKGLEK
jgi:hypothetical protein